MARGDGGLGKADPWPTNDRPFENEDNPSPHFDDGYYNRAPGGAHTQGPADYWLDCAVYPERTAWSEEQDRQARDFRVSVGNITGKKPGPSTD